jgi:hypothetical protein
VYFTSTIYFSFLKATAASTTPTNDYFSELNQFWAATSSVDIITEWLNSLAIPSVSDPIAWWSVMEQARNPLARMSLDFLSAPGVLQCVCNVFFIDN